MNKAKIKRMLDENTFIYRFLDCIYCFFTNRKRLMYKKSYGNKNPNEVFYVIRPSTDDGIQGLLSLFTQTMRQIDYAKKKGYIPYVDFKNFKTQYYDGKNNVWELYFTQPSNVTLEEIFASKNVIYSGVSLKKTENLKLYKSSIFYDKEICDYCHNLIWNNINLTEEVKKIVNKENMEINVEKCIGVYVRGTDYIKLKPSGEYAQPDLEDVIKKIEEFLKKYPDNNIFLVTEDYEYYRRLKDKFNKKLKIVSFDSFIKDYKGNDYLSRTELLAEDKYKRGLDYLVKIILLSKCDKLISSITCGSVSAFALNGNKYSDKYIFNLGKYK